MTTVIVSAIRRRRFVCAVASFASIGTIAGVSISLPATATAQSVSEPAPPRFEAGAALEYAQPVSQFSQNVRRGFGGGGHLILGIDPARVLGIRVNADYINYGNASQYFQFNSGFQSTVLEQRTSNNIFVATVGPQLTFPSGPIRPYVNGGVGIAYFYTQTSLKQNDPYSNQSVDLAQATDYSDNSLAYTGSAGFYFPVQSSFLIDVGARYNAIGKTRYLTKGDITADPNSPSGILVTPHESDARFISYRLGVSLRF